MAEQLLRELMFKAALLIIVLSLIALSLIAKLPFPQVIIQVSTLLGFAYFIALTAGSVIEKTEKLSVELFLSKPFTRREIILADFLGTVSVVSFLLVLFSVGMWLIFAFRQHVWDPTLLSFSLSMIVGFSALYSFVVLTGILIRNTAIVILFWVGYVYFGALLLETRSDFIYSKISEWYVRAIFDALYYTLPPIYSVTRVFSRFTFNTINDFLPIILSLVSGAAALMSAVFIFNRSDLD